MQSFTIEPIATIHNDYKDKFGIPRQSGLFDDSFSTIVFEPKYRDENALRGLEGYSHIWLLWQFDRNNSDKGWSPTVRPPRLGGNKRVGVFATRSPYHPNGIGLSCVKLVSIEKDKENGIVLMVSGADLLDETPIIDIKPYLSLPDSYPDAKCGFADDVCEYELNVNVKTDTKGIPPEVLCHITEILKQDPRPSYQNDAERVYGMNYGEYEIKFQVSNKELFVLSIEKSPNGSEK